jgi:sugar (pentulose or hexulose) kinase
MQPLSAVLAAVGAGLFPSIQEAGGAMVHETAMIEPNQDRHTAYQFYVDAYIDTYARLQDLVHTVTRRMGEHQPVEVVS